MRRRALFTIAGAACMLAVLFPNLSHAQDQTIGTVEPAATVYAYGPSGYRHSSPRRKFYFEQQRPDWEQSGRAAYYVPRYAPQFYRPWGAHSPLYVAPGPPSFGRPFRGYQDPRRSKGPAFRAWPGRNFYDRNRLRRHYGEDYAGRLIKPFGPGRWRQAGPFLVPYRY